eukprot:1145861-Pelagomonas_calceolata.AAC.7
MRGIEVPCKAWRQQAGAWVHPDPVLPGSIRTYPGMRGQCKKTHAHIHTHTYSLTGGRVARNPGPST